MSIRYYANQKGILILTARDESKSVIVSMFTSKLENLLQWIKNTSDETSNPSSHSYISPKITVKDVQDFGRSIYSSTAINKSELLFRIPPSFLLNSTTVIRHITRHNHSIKLTNPCYLSIFVPYKTVSDKYTAVYASLSLDQLLELTSFQLLSLYITFETQRGSDSFWKPFWDMLPDLDDLRLTPLVWRVTKAPQWEHLWSLLPRATQAHAEKVWSRFVHDVDVVHQLLSTQGLSSEEIHQYLPQERFLWAWMCVNSRCLYMELPQSKDNHDNFTMAPYVDFLNHACDDQCTLKINSIGFQVSTTSKYAAGDQLFLSYGPHSNTFLLCEYGFVLPSDNTWNDLDITHIILPLLKPKQVDYLKDQNYYGEYTLNANSGISFRTEVVLAVLQEQTPGESRRLNGLLNGNMDGLVYQKNSNTLLKKILEKVVYDCDQKMKLEYNDDIDEFTKERKRVIGILYRDMKLIARTELEKLELLT
ncbi:SET domain-containing protein [Suhomyces tanzawaensis NRRL Y-17324]|uniref:SET domain-containing protein n=1 Tax=Suhomyces tanzawaensis NRRL Y-17324 TaxID=984487 RepID=A0A1E4SLZ1_9ASCO|nr:SET domain-containing protein [Suhomyces tanzawaensis NRRL Y-17324]ODV80544.1 SET domain-containing protein [Suhomyces tanzawaensis NRRL Y-17324]